MAFDWVQCPRDLPRSSASSVLRATVSVIDLRKCVVLHFLHSSGTSEFLPICLSRFSTASLPSAHAHSALLSLSTPPQTTLVTRDAQEAFGAAEQTVQHKHERVCAAALASSTIAAARAEVAAALDVHRRQYEREAECRSRQRYRCHAAAC